MHEGEAQVLHDLRNAAAVIRSAAAQLNDGTEALADGAGRLAEMIERRSAMLVRLLDDLTVMHQVDRGDLEVTLQRVDVDELCRFALAQRSSPGGSIDCEVEPGTVAVADPVRLTQVVDNLLLNALRYGGPEISVRAGRDGRWVRIEVADGGPGVPDALVEHLFDPYVRGPDSVRAGGLGLGLTIVRQLCRAQGGEVRYDASAGTRFTVLLPAAADAPSGVRDVG